MSAEPRLFAAADLLEPSTGQIDGQTAIAIYPAKFEGRKATEILSLDDCRVKLKSKSSFEVFTRPCGQWFLVPPDRYAYWAEKAWQISPYSKRLVYAGGAFSGRGLVGAAPMGPGGRVALPRDFASSKDFQLRLIHAGPHEVDGLLRGALSHRVRSDQVGEGVLMPVGPTLAAVHDLGSSRPVMLSRPFETAHRKTTPAPLEKPDPDRAFLLVQLVRHEFALRVVDDTVQLRLETDPKKTPRPPDLRIALTGSLYGVWYDLEPGSVRVLAEGTSSFLEPLALQLEPGEIKSVSGELLPHPKGASLDVEVDLPAALETAENRIEIRTSGDETVAKKTLEQGEWQLRFENLPPGILKVEIETRLGSFGELVQVEEAEEGYVRLAPDLIELEGEVSRGEEPLAADLRFVTALGDEIDVSTDEQGRYRLVSLEWLRSVSIQPVGSEATPFFEVFRPELIRESRTLDFEIPRNRFEVRVVDALSGDPVVGASVATKNHYGKDKDPDSRSSVMQTAETDEDGIARLPPLRPGKLEFQVYADGYERLHEERSAEVLELDEERRLDVRLIPAGESIEVRLLLPNGSPAQGAEVALVDAGGAVVHRDVADKEGAASLPPGEAGTVVAIRHQAAAFALRPWEGEADHQVWRLEAPAMPLRVRVFDVTGDEPLGRARIGLWSDGRFLSGSVLFLLSRSRPFADAAGYWSIENLPREEVGLVAWGRGVESSVIATMPSMATIAAPPWPEVLEVRAVN